MRIRFLCQPVVKYAFYTSRAQRDALRFEAEMTALCDAAVGGDHALPGDHARLQTPAAAR